MPGKLGLKGKWHRYFPDFVVEVKQADGPPKIIMIEVKPHAQTNKPKIPKKRTPKTRRRHLKEGLTYAVNQTKWEYARAFCAKHGWQFQILTEKDVKFT